MVSASAEVSPDDGTKTFQIVEAMLRTRATTRQKKIIQEFEHLRAAVASSRIRLSRG
jgi:hypothetical protein